MFAVMQSKSESNDYLIVPQGDAKHYHKYEILFSDCKSRAEAHYLLDVWRGDKFEINGE